LEVIIVEQQVIDAVADKGILNMENGIKVFAAVGAVAIGVVTYRAFRNVCNKQKQKENTVRKDSGKTTVKETIDVEAEVVVESDKVL
jgi:outer membrane lipoprotein SlyB